MCTSIRGISAGLLVFMFIIVLRCSTQQVTGAGTGSETVIGKIVKEDGTPAESTEVRLLPENFDPVSNNKYYGSEVDTTDHNGRYSIILTSSENQKYTLQAKSLTTQTRAIISDIDISAPADSSELDDVSLYKTGNIKVVFSDTLNASGYVFIPGTNYYSYLENGSAVIDSVPAQLISQIYYKDSVQQNPLRSIAVNIDVQPEITTIIASSGQQFARKIILNTSASGADVAGTVIDFPVLIRLRADNFDFSQAKPDGSDLNFTRADGEAIPHEIERWDAVGKIAEIWVKVDTVYGNNSTQFILIHWGNSNAQYSSKSTDVFSSDAGYKGVWHLGGSGETILEATANSYNGSRRGNQVRADGKIGFAQFFDGDGDFTDMGDVCNPDMANLTLCAWVKKIGTDKIQTIIAKSTGELPNETYGWLFQLDKDGALSVFMASGGSVWGELGSFVLTSNIWITDSIWHHVAAVIDRSNSDNCRLYIDGADVSTLPTGGDITKVSRVINSFPLRLGSDANDEYQWEGAIDECSIIYMAQSPDFIKLSYMNQKSDNMLTFFK